MRTSEPLEVERWLAQHNGFSECIIERLVVSHYGTTFEVVINNIWDANGSLRSDLEESFLIILRFSLVQELHVNNALTHQMRIAPQNVNWGLNEVALVILVKDSDLIHSDTSLMHIAFLWEGTRRIDVVFSELEVLPGNLS
jgi:hypothetical protein